MNEMGLTEAWKFNTPFYYYKNKWFCYLIYIKKKDETYISFVLGNKIESPNLLSEGRKQMKIYKINPNENINILELKEIVSSLKNFYIIILWIFVFSASLYKTRDYDYFHK